jgi:hypothetical protein
VCILKDIGIESRDREGEKESKQEEKRKEKR